MNSYNIWIISSLFLLSYIGFFWKRIPNAAVVISASFFVIASGTIDQDEAIQAIDFNTLGLLCGMMMMVHLLRGTGIFEYIAIKAVKYSKGSPVKILLAFSIVTAVLSAILDNVTTVLVVVPVALAVTHSINLRPDPFLITIILMSNIGGAATLIGDPPNILIAARANLTFIDFLNNDAPIAVFCGIVTMFILWFYFRKDLTTIDSGQQIIENFSAERAIRENTNLRKGILIFTTVIIGFATHQIHHIELATISLAGAFVLVVWINHSLEKTLSEVDWSTLFFFLGLFVMVAGLQKTGLIDRGGTMLIQQTHADTNLVTIGLMPISAVFSSLINSVPYTVTMLPVVENLSAQLPSAGKALWWSLSLGACLGANATLLGSAANLIVVQIARKDKIEISFLQFMKIGVPITIINISLSSIYVYYRYL